MEQEFSLPCGATIRVTKKRTVSDSTKSMINWLPYASLVINTEVQVPSSDYSEECDEDKKSVEIPIQLRSIDLLITFLTHLKEELQK